MRIGLLAVVALAPFAIAAPRINFVRTIPARHDLGGERAAIVYAIGDNDKVTTFVDVLLTHTNREGSILRVDDAVDRSRHLFGERLSDAEIKKLNREHPADIWLGVHHFSCDAQQRGGEGSTYDVDGTRIKRRQMWIDATCSARIDVIQPSTAKRLFSFEVKGEGTSPRVVEITDEERGIALEQAARYAAIMASESITPRRVRESIELDEGAPMFDRGSAMIDAGRLEAARALWEAELAKNDSSAALHFDVGAVCEALNDVDCARDHYRAAARIAPGDARYRTELDLFRKRWTALPH
jgi:tetratricopeptide (TPR) repeat protein